jgi:cell wall-associated NlpC family hydrolase
MTLDRRIHAFRPDLAARSLQGKVEAMRFVDGEAASIAVGRASLRNAPSPDAAQDTELLHGEAVTVYERKDGWAWVQAQNDSYVGYLRAECLATPFEPQLQITALMTPVFPKPDFKTPVRDMLPMTAEVGLLDRVGDFLQIGAEAFVHRHHVGLLAEAQSDWVAVAEAFFGVPYVWGGKTFAGLDCSGLVQTALAAAGMRSPRDTDMMERQFGDSPDLTPFRGDLIFWKGHVGIMLDDQRLLHANAFHMLVAIEDLADAMARIEKIAGPVTSMKRPRI